MRSPKEHEALAFSASIKSKMTKFLPIWSVELQSALFLSNGHLTGRSLQSSFAQASQRVCPHLRDRGGRFCRSNLFMQIWHLSKLSSTSMVLMVLKTDSDLRRFGCARGSFSESALLFWDDYFRSSGPLTLSLALMASILA